MEDNVTSEIRKVKIALVKVDRTYQRDLKPHHRTIAREWNPDACQPLTLGEREDNSLWVIDGQQRLAALKILKIEEWMARVHQSSGPEFEANLFQIMGGGQRSTLTLTPRDIFKAQLATRETFAVRAKEAVESVGFSLSPTSHSGTWPNIQCFKFLHDITKREGTAPIVSGLSAIKIAWPGQARAVKADIVSGMVQLFSYCPSADPIRLGNLLKTTYPEAIVADARLLTGDTKTAVARILADKYNYRLRSGKIVVSKK